MTAEAYKSIFKCFSFSPFTPKSHYTNERIVARHKRSQANNTAFASASPVTVWKPHGGNQYQILRVFIKMKLLP